MNMGVRPEERFVEEEEPGVKGEGDDRDDPTVVELAQPFDSPVEELGGVAVAPSTSSGGMGGRNEGWLL